ncbi:DUF3426 domain-containing protein [Psychrobacter sp. B38]|uniref:DUF3426 domain-containing protein n=1 Tax=Psychrobacter sp. B38 TaxID=3143538 RepID=UPI00321104E5
MTTPIETQCPHCKACFSVQQTQLNKVSAVANCDHCQQRFLVNQHLIVTPDTSTTQPHITTDSRPHKKEKNKLSNTKASQHKASTKEFPADALIHDDLIYDDMDIDEPSESILEYDSLDSMDAWLDQAHKPSRPPVNGRSKTPNRDSLSSIKSSATIATSAPLLSSVAANDIHASIDNHTNNSWLEKLLKEQNEQEDETSSSININSTAVPHQSTNKASKARIRTPQAPEKFSVSPESQSIASILWALGCLVLALLLFAQYVIFNLENLVKNPVYAERLQAVCSVAVCSLPSANIDAFTIANTKHKSSAVNTTDNFSDISALLTNQSDKAQLYPNVQVSVYGADGLVGEFIAEPTDYLLGKQSQLTANGSRRLLFTIPIANKEIREVVVTPLY